MHLFLEQLLNGMAVGSIYALVSLGLALVYGILRILHVAHAAVYTVGAYLGLFFFQMTQSLLVAFLGAMACCALAGVTIERLVYFPLLKYPPYVPLIASIAILLALEEVCRLVAGPYILTFPASLPFPAVHVLGVHVPSSVSTIFATTGLILLVLWFLTTRTETGLAMRAVSQDLAIAEAMGIDAHAVVSFTFALGSAIAAVAGILVGIYYNQVYATMGSVPAYKALALIVVGGLGSVPGAVAASLLLGIAETLLIGYAHVPLPRDALAFIAMIAVLMWRAEGLFGSR
ncbi:branched-chain amino acid ABC transporter permease [Desulfosoma caldarium]|uniref:Branched-chain amino acid transport system permease protein n=1 Tax=Desulfosoma caldarium TaxID=610254 RepID=A0A3N1UNB7_9BACT|nr:branched-chain amino acid ABC transporter permease [Desulfosoma caldarium]ROQ90220.1 branched-chain amino acid transport system permease protein [Desulfosoma caldarium]